MLSNYDKLEANRVNKSLIAAGSFWSDHVLDRRVPVELVKLAYSNRLLEQADTFFRKLLNSAEYRVSNIFHPFNPEDVVFTGDALVDGVGQFDESTLPNRFDQGACNIWSLQLKVLELDLGLETGVREEVYPVRICDKNGHTLLLNSDFYVKGDLIQFKMDPRDIFSDNKFLVTEGVRVPKNIYSFPLNYETSHVTSAVQDFARSSQSPKHFKLAIAEVAGLKVLPSTQTLKHIDNSDISGLVTYTFETDVITVNYEHDLLEVNKRYPKHTVVGDGIRMYTPNNKTKWWKEIDFGGGLALGPIVGKSGLLLPEGLVLAYAANAEAGSYAGDKLHVRLDLIGHPDSVDNFWEAVEAKESASGTYLNSVVGIGGEDTQVVDSNFVGIFDRLLDATAAANVTNSKLGLGIKEYRNIKNLRKNEIINPADPLTEQAPALKVVNGIDVFFEAILGQTGCVIIIDAAQIGDNLKEVTRFVNMQQPVGMCLILILRYTITAVDENLNTLISASVKSSGVSQSSNESTLNLNGIIVDSYTARIDT